MATKHSPSPLRDTFERLKAWNMARRSAVERAEADTEWLETQPLMEYIDLPGAGQPIDVPAE